MSLDNPLVFVGLFFACLAFVGLVLTFPRSTRGWGTLLLYGTSAAFTVWAFTVFFILIFG